MNLMLECLFLETTSKALRSNEVFRFLEKAPNIVQRRVALFLHPWPEVIAMGQTRRLIDHIRTRHAPSDAVVYAYLKTPLYLSTIKFQGKRYVSQIGNNRHSLEGQVDLVTVHNDELFFWSDFFGIRGISADINTIPKPNRDEVWRFGRVDLRSAASTASLIGHTNVGDLSLYSFLCRTTKSKA